MLVTSNMTGDPVVPGYKINQQQAEGH